MAVSANIVPLAFGTETDTSIIGPAGINGVVGIKPTVGLTSRKGVIPISKNLDTVGCFGRTVADTVHGLSAIVGNADEMDDQMCSSVRDAGEDFAGYLTSRTALKGARFGLPFTRCWEKVTPSLRVVADEILNAIEEAGAEIIRTDFPCAEDRIGPEGTWNWSGPEVVIEEKQADLNRSHGPPDQSEFTVVRTDAYNGINGYLSGLSNTFVKSVEDIIDYNDHNSGTEGASPGDIPAFPSGQVCAFDVIE